MKSDKEIHAQVLEALEFDPKLVSERIGVSVDKGVVTLSGSVEHYSDKVEAVSCAAHVFGVKAVVNNLSVNFLGFDLKPDKQIADAVHRALEWNVMIPSSVHASVEDAVVTLRGDVHWNFQKKAAMSAISDIAGILEIKDRIKVSPRIEAKNIENKIKMALERSADEDANHIKAEVHGNKVVLKGKVHSLSSCKEAEWAAWSAPGVFAVDSQIRIGS